MGDIVKYKCSNCGLDTDTLFVGCGFAMGHALVCFECLDCHKIMTKDVGWGHQPLPGDKECEFCGGTNLVKWEEVCPKCGNKMDCEDCGCWD